MSVVSACAVNVKCRAMYSQLLSRADYDVLLESQSVSQVAAYLKKKAPYASILASIDENSAHRRDLERMLKDSLFHDCTKLLRFSAGGYNTEIRNVFLSYEVDELKQIISSNFFSKRKCPFRRKGDLIFLRNYSKIKVETLLSSNTFGDFVENLMGSRFYEALKPFAEKDVLNFFEIDNAIDKVNFESALGELKKKIGKAGKAGNEGQGSVYGTVADVTNLFFIYRMKKLLASNPEDIIMRLIPHHYKMTRADLLVLAECEGIENLVELMSKSKYGFLFPIDSESAWEDNYYEYLYAIHKKNFRKPLPNALTSSSYLFLKEIDIKNIITIIEGIRYSMPALGIARHLTGYRQGA
ncbi:MAG: V-type ATPase subunit [Oscillospiraceae bacterium]|nr:V-type ATPase subunit [Oscillospiraceae bacterium]